MCYSWPDRLERQVASYIPEAMSILATTCSVLHGNRFPWVLVDEFVFGCHGMWARMLVANLNPAGTALEWCVVRRR